MKRLLVLQTLILFIIIPRLYAVDGISVIADSSVLRNSMARASIEDCLGLLKKAFSCDVEINRPSFEILLVLPSLDTNYNDTDTGSQAYPTLHYPEHDYSWISERKGKHIHLNLHTNTAEGISCGLYGFLQEQLWFAFYHPRQTVIPDMQFWPLTEEFEWSARPRFNKKGFHLHTMHPLELTEPLLNPDCPDGIEQIKEYIDWLARNQQNYFEFNLLETDELEKWVEYISPVVDYAHSRGILMGIDLSLHMTQQKAFMLYKNFPASFKTAKRQIRENLNTLFMAKWDVIAMECSSTEFTKGNADKTQKLQLYITDLVCNKYGAKLAGREHVVKNDNLMGSQALTTELSEENKKLDAKRGIFIHTVMFYGLTDKQAPVYENENLLHMLDLLKKEQKERETWYYPESAYWITFDNSVPMLLMPYLQTRMDDILLMDSLNVEGHLTFSSGWEWGYWLIDWSIARWSWEHSFKGKTTKPRPTQFLCDVFLNKEIVENLNKISELQQKYIKDDQLIRYLVAQTVTDELPEPLNLELHPRPPKSYKWLRKKANADDLLILQKNTIDPLLKFAEECDSLLFNIKSKAHLLDAERAKILNELHMALTVTKLRARHKAHTLSLLSAKRNLNINPRDTINTDKIIEKAQQVRKQAQELVRKQEKSYRYPLNLIARKIEGGGKTCYDFGYLYPVSELHFWKREEQQIIQNKFGPFFMSIWDIPRILGIVD